MAHVRRSSQPTLLLSTHAEKAFDIVDWDYLMATLSHLGIGTPLLIQIAALYNYPTAQLRINGTLSDPFTLYNGTRQGCPLSPILFALLLEPFLSTVRHNPSIHGIALGELEHKYAAYADDILFYIQQPLISLPSLMSEFSTFSDISNFKINMTKSEILNISIPAKVVLQLKRSFPFSWQEHKMKYLGIYLTSNPTALFCTNFLPLLLGRTCRNGHKWLIHGWEGLEL